MRPSTAPVYLASLVLVVGCQAIPPAGLVLHVESDQGITLSGQSLATWADQSMFGNDGSPFSTAPAPGAETLAGRPTLRFAGDAGPQDGAQGVVFKKPVHSAAGSTSVALVRVKDPGAPLNDISLSIPELRGVDSDGDTIGLRASAADGSLNLLFGGGGKAVEATIPALGRWVAVTAVHAPDGGVKLFADGSQVVSGNVGAPVARGRNVVLSGGITSAETAALIVYDRALPDSERTAVESYLQSKWQYR